jgi:hypothetical protein
MVGKPKGKRPFERTKRRRDGNIKVDLKEACLGNVDRIHRAQDRNQRRAFSNTAVTFGFHKGRRISIIAERLLASEEEPDSTELVSQEILYGTVLTKARNYHFIRGYIVEQRPYHRTLISLTKD